MHKKPPNVDQTSRHALIRIHRVPENKQATLIGEIHLVSWYSGVFVSFWHKC